MLPINNINNSNNNNCNSNECIEKWDNKCLSINDLRWLQWPLQSFNESLIVINYTLIAAINWSLVRLITFYYCYYNTHYNSSDQYYTICKCMFRIKKKVQLAVKLAKDYCLERNFISSHYYRILQNLNN